MKIQKGHYVPKELITSEAVHEAVVRCFVAAGFHRNSDYVDYRSKEHWECIAISGSGVICWSQEQEKPLTLQQLFTAENGLQCPDWATEIRTDDNAVWFFGGSQAEYICGHIQPIPHRALAIRQPKEKEVKAINKAEYVSELRDNKPFDRKVSGFVKAAANKIVDDIMKRDPIGMSNENKNQESIWFEFGDFPPIGSKITVTKGGEKLSDFGGEFVGKDCIVRSVFENQHGKKIVSIERPDGACCCFVLEILKPIRTHREKVIGAVDSLIHDYQAGAEIRTEFLNVLYDAGMLVLPQNPSDTED